MNSKYNVYRLWIILGLRNTVLKNNALAFCWSPSKDFVGLRHFVLCNFLTIYGLNVGIFASK